MEFTRELAFRFPLMRGEDVRAVQQALTIVQSTPPCGVVDGIFGNATRLAVMGFQRSRGLAEDGVVGRQTWAALVSRAERIQAPLQRPAPLVAAALKSLPPDDLPLNEAAARRAQDWMMRNFGRQIEAAVRGAAPIDAATVCAIACKETAPVWLPWIARLSPAEVLARCVFDGSGDVPGTSRSAFPRNTAAFRARYGDALTEALIAEANATRRLRGYGDQRWLYKGYGIFQYDLQHCETDLAFFKDRLWRSFDECLDRFMREMRTKLAASGGELRDAVRRYNGSGPRAEQYAEQVMFMRGWLADMPAALAA